MTFPTVADIAVESVEAHPAGAAEDRLVRDAKDTLLAQVHPDLLKMSGNEPRRLSTHLSLLNLSGRKDSLVPTYSGARGKPLGAGASDEPSDTVNTRVKNIRPILPPACLMEELPTSRAVDRTVVSTRKQISDIVNMRDDRVIAVVGPCSIHDVKAAMEYARNLKALSDELQNDILIIMRVYFEKPRTTIGWKGLINDPLLDGTYKINTGLRWARKLLLDVVELGLPVGTEWLDTITPQFIADLVSWGAIGARTTESQVHRQLVSGLSMPVGFKNGTTGKVDIAANAVISSRSPHHYMGTTQQGLAAIVETTGNQDCHVILRGGTNGPNHTAEEVQAAIKACHKCKLFNAGLVIDLSHGNSKKDYRNQPKCMDVVSEQIEAGCRDIVGIMCESNLVEGNQKLVLGNADQLVYGQSITDSCVSFEETATILRRLAKAVRTRRVGCMSGTNSPRSSDGGVSMKM